MTELKSEYAHATLEDTYEDTSRQQMFAAYCDSDCADEIDFIPYDGSGESGSVIIWFTSSWALKHLGDERVKYEQFGYKWHNVSKEDFVRIIGDEISIGAKANSILIQPRANESALVWRNYR